ncbi:MAG: hypothetical protein J0I96_15095 [Rhodanobacter sp.]|uniref:hypothetical protein n=1 Tax=Rhodanobacter sp. PCA2 TaxID=2006117 RepID=UPI0015E76891|nr:hypothetical protein [Rhodanobacter sp. PCA2]MBN8924400.1 hypothetical protein [Rhodanobacter sp.]
MNTIAESIRIKVDAGAYEEALRLSNEAKLKGEFDGAALGALLTLTATLRSRCMDLAAKKKDVGPDYESMENLIREANELTGEDMYGRFI